MFYKIISEQIVIKQWLTGDFSLEIPGLKVVRNGSALRIITPEVETNIIDHKEIDYSKNHIIITGPSGSGKGTQGEMLLELLDIPRDNYFSAGAILRKMINMAELSVETMQDLEKMGISSRILLTENPTIINDLRTQKQISESRDATKKAFSGKTTFDWLKYAVANGRLIPDCWTESIMENIFQNLPIKNGFILDGYPRTEKAARHLVHFFNKMNIPVDQIIVLYVHKQKVAERLLERKRLDDTEESIKARIDFYQDHVEPAIDILQNAFGDKKVKFIGFKAIYDRPSGKLNIEASIRLIFEEIKKLFMVQKTELITNYKNNL